jgi:hypothetical protein
MLSLRYKWTASITCLERWLAKYKHRRVTFECSSHHIFMVVRLPIASCTTRIDGSYSMPIHYDKYSGFW